MGRRPSELKDGGRWEVLEFPSHSDTLVATDAAKDRTHQLGEKHFVVGGDLAVAVQQVAAWTRPRVRNVLSKMHGSLALLGHGTVQHSSYCYKNGFSIFQLENTCTSLLLSTH